MYPKQNYTGALRFVETTRTEEDAVFTVGLAVVPYRDYYRRAWQGVSNSDEFRAVRSHSGRVWMLYSFLEYVEPGLASLIQHECPPVRIFYGTLGGGDVVVCTLRPRLASRAQDQMLADGYDWVSVRIL